MMSYSNVQIGDVTVPVHPARRPELVPKGYLKKFGDLKSPEVIAHMRWIAQKYVIGQDICLLSHPGPLARHLVLALAELCDWEVEHLVVTKDTSESDLKQRREIFDGGVVFTDQPPVRAAIHGRILLLDGIEKAERNVLPTLNNLLENREMALEDGRFLATAIKRDEAGSERLVQVHPSFRVVALGFPVPPYPGRTLDPPLRSRFQGRFISDLSLDSLLQCIDTSEIVLEDLQPVVNLYETIRLARAAASSGEGATQLAAIPSYGHGRIGHCMELLRAGESVREALARSFPLGRCLGLHAGDSGIDTEFGRKLFPSLVQSAQALCAGVREKKTMTGPSDDQQLPQGQRLTRSQSELVHSLLQDLQIGSSVCIFGIKGSGKSHIMRACALSSPCLSWRQPLVFPLYQEMSARDLLQHRGASRDEASGTVATAWRDSPLVVAARRGNICVLDGIDRVDPQYLLAAARLLGDGWVDLPSGERLVSHPDFRFPTTHHSTSPGISHHIFT